MSKGGERKSLRPGAATFAYLSLHLTLLLFTFFKAVRARDGAAAEPIITNPSSDVVNSIDPATGEGALHIVTRGRDATWLSYMLANRARPNLQEPTGTTALQIAAQIGWIEGAEILLARGANINLGNRRGETPLILAVQGRSVPMVRLLMSRGADPARTDSIAGNSALDYARQDRDQTIARLIESSVQARRNVVGPSQD